MTLNSTIQGFLEVLVPFLQFRSAPWSTNRLNQGCYASLALHFQLRSVETGHLAECRAFNKKRSTRCQLIEKLNWPHGRQKLEFLGVFLHIRDTRWKLRDAVPWQLRSAMRTISLYTSWRFCSRFRRHLAEESWCRHKTALKEEGCLKEKNVSETDSHCSSRVPGSQLLQLKKKFCVPPTQQTTNQPEHLAPLPMWKWLHTSCQNDWRGYRKLMEISIQWKSGPTTRLKDPRSALSFCPASSESSRSHDVLRQEPTHQHLDNQRAKRWANVTWITSKRMDITSKGMDVWISHYTIYK